MNTEISFRPKTKKIDLKPEDIKDFGIIEDRNEKYVGTVFYLWSGEVVSTADCYITLILS